MEHLRSKAEKLLSRIVLGQPVTLQEGFNLLVCHLIITEVADFASRGRPVSRMPFAPSELINNSLICQGKREQMLIVFVISFELNHVVIEEMGH